MPWTSPWNRSASGASAARHGGRGAVGIVSILAAFVLLLGAPPDPAIAAPTLTLTASPSPIPADGSVASRLTVTLVDPSGGCPNAFVTLNASAGYFGAGTLSEARIITSGCTPVSVTLRGPGGLPGAQTATVTASALGATVSTTVVIDPAVQAPAGAQVALTLDGASSHSADGSSFSRYFAVARDGLGNCVSNAVFDVFTDFGTLGTGTPGIVANRFIAGVSTGPTSCPGAAILVRSFDVGAGTLAITFAGQTASAAVTFGAPTLSAGPYSLQVTTSPPVIAVDGSVASRVTVGLFNQTGACVPYVMINIEALSGYIGVQVTPQHTQIVAPISCGTSVFVRSPGTPGPDTIIASVAALPGVTAFATVQYQDQVPPAFVAASPPATATVGTPYPGYTFVASGAPPPNYFIASGSLPTGMLLDFASGFLFGTPTTAGPFTFQVGASNLVGAPALTPEVTITVAPPPPTAPVFTAATPPSTAALAFPLNYRFTASGPPAPTFALASGSLPPGMRLESDGQLWGWPLTVGAYTFAVRASNGVGTPATTGNLSMTVGPVVPFTQWTIDDFSSPTGSVPPSGTNLAGVFGGSRSLTGAGSLGSHFSCPGLEHCLVVFAGISRDDLTTTLTYDRAGAGLGLDVTEFGALQVLISTGNPAVTVSIADAAGHTATASPSANASVVFAAMPGIEAVDRAHIERVTVTLVTPTRSTTNVAGIRLVRGAPSISLELSPPGVIAIGAPVSARATLSGLTADGGGQVTYTRWHDSGCTNVFYSPGPVPSTVPASNGALAPSGVVTFASAGTFYFKAGYSGDADNLATSVCVPVTVQDLPRFLDASPPADWVVGAPFDYEFTTGGITAGQFSVMSGALPTGLALNVGSGRVTGMPTAAGIFEFTIGAAGSDGKSAQTPSLRITVAPRPAADNFLILVSQAGDYVGRGRLYVYSSPSKAFTASGSPDRNHVQVGMLTPGDWWFLDFAAIAGQALVPGTYTGATRFPFQSPTAPGLSVGGNGAGCNMLTGSFTVLEAAYRSDGSVIRFHATFEQHCEGNTPALLGEVQYVQRVVSTVTATATPLGAGAPPASLAMDDARVSGDGPPPSGTMRFFLCGPGLAAPASASTGCQTGGTAIGNGVPVESGGRARSAATQPEQTMGIGLYCWRAEYSGDASYLAGAASDPSRQCFTTVASVRALTTMVNQLVARGVVSPNNASSLITKLTEAQTMLDRGGTTPAREVLNAFILEVEAQRGKAIPTADAQRLIAIARLVIQSP